MKIFLSYADEDADVVATLTPGLVGHEFYDWKTAPGGRSIVAEIEREILAADAFFLILSPSYLSSDWCLRERAFAIHLDTERAKRPFPFISVIAVEAVPEDQAGLLRDVRWVDVVPPAPPDAFSRYVAQLNEEFLRGGAEPARARPQVPVLPGFRNRDDELLTIRNDLADSGGQHFWVVTAPPQLGKSWFLDQFARTRPEGWGLSKVDLHAAAVDLRHDARLLVAELFQAEPCGDNHHLAVELARQIVVRGTIHLCLLDGGELLDKKTIQEIREILGMVRENVQASRKPGARLGFVVASRQQDTWGGVLPKPAVRPLSLTEFHPSVVRDALTELAGFGKRQFSATELAQIAMELHDVTAGLPHLVTGALAWLQRTEWADLRSLQTPRLFDELVRPYVAERLLSLESLFPQGGEQLPERKEALVGAFRDLAPYRLFTMSHLRHVYQLDGDLRQKLVAAAWSVEDLWAAMGRTALVLQPATEPWYRVFPAIQRVVLRYFLPDLAAQDCAHAQARDFYDQWHGDRPAGSEQGAIFVESLWHETARQRGCPPDQIREQILSYAGRRSGTLNTSLFEDTEMRSLAVRILENDSELQEQLARIAGLTEEITEVIQHGASGGTR